MSTNPDTPVQGTGIDGAANQIEAFLTSQEAPETPDEKEEAADAPAETAEALEADAEGDETTAEDDLLADDAEEEATETDDDADEEDEGEQLYTVKIDGKEEQVTLEEALKGYQRQSDYTRKSQALAESRKAYEAEVASFTEVANAVAEERAQYAQLLSALASQLDSQLQEEPDWEALHRQNPLEFAYQRAQWEDAQKRREAAQSELSRVQEAQLRQLVATETEKLLEVMPEWKDPDTAKADRQKIREFGKSVGFTDEELSNTFDHRAVRVLRMAQRYAEMQANRPAAKQRKGPKVARAGTPAAAPTERAKVKSARKRLAETGSREAAAALFETLL